MNKASWLLAGLLAIPGLGAGVAWARGRVSLGQTQDQVRDELGRPDEKIVQLTPQENLEIWSYKRSYRVFWMGDCGFYTPHHMAGLPQEVEPLRCEERARVVFMDGRVAAFVERD